MSTEKKVQQVALLYASMVLVILTSIGVSIVNTHALGPDSFGALKFFQSLFTFSVTLSTLGLFVSNGRLLATAEDEHHRRGLIGAMVVIAALIMVILAIVLYLVSHLDLDIFSDEWVRGFRLSLPLVLAVILQVSLENCLKGENRILELAMLRILPGIIYLCVASFLYFSSGLTLTLALMNYLGAIALVAIVIVIRLKPEFNAIRRSVDKIIAETKRYGFHVYTGVLMNVGTSQISGIALAFFIDAVAVGYFLLAKTISTPLTMISTNVGTAFFKKFTSSKKISNRVFGFTLGISFITLCVFLTVIGYFVDFVYPEEFRVIKPLIYIIAIGSVIQGVGGFVNNFLCAQGFGKNSRNAAALQGVANIFGFTVLVNYFGMYGAAYTVVISSLCFTAVIIFYYRKITQNPRTSEPKVDI